MREGEILGAFWQILKPSLFMFGSSCNPNHDISSKRFQSPSKNLNQQLVKSNFDGDIRTKSVEYSTMHRLNRV